MYQFFLDHHRVLPVQSAPVYPLVHVHCDDEHIVLSSRSVHWVVELHTIPTTAETEGEPLNVTIGLDKHIF